MSELLIASDPQELVVAQTTLIHEVDGKIESAKQDAKAAHDMLEQMKAARLSIGEAKRMHAAATSRVTYLIKVKAALEAGYVMMPDMEGNILAVRSDRTTPSPAAKRVRKGGWKHSAESSVPDELPRFLPPGEGRYISPRQFVDTRHSKVQGPHGERDEYTSRAISLRDPYGLDRQFVRPEVISRTAGAMTRRIFDEIVTVRPVATRQRRSRDPIVLGRVIDKETRRCCAFLIAWFVNPATDI